MKNKSSIVGVVIPLANKQAREDLQKIHANIEVAQQKRDEILKDEVFVSNASIEKDILTGEIKELKAEKLKVQGEIKTKKRELEKLSEVFGANQETNTKLEERLSQFPNLDRDIGELDEKINTLNQEWQCDEWYLVELDEEIRNRQTNIANLKTDHKKKSDANEQTLSDQKKEIDIEGRKITQMKVEQQTIEAAKVEAQTKLDGINKDINLKGAELLELGTKKVKQEVALNKAAEEAKKKLDEELAAKKAEFDKAIAAEKKDLADREALLAHNNKRYKQAVVEFYEAKEALEMRYGRKLPNIVL